MLEGALIFFFGAVVGWLLRHHLPTKTEEKKENPYDKYRDAKTGLFSRKAVKESKSR